MNLIQSVASLWTLMCVGCSVGWKTSYKAACYNSSMFLLKPLFLSRLFHTHPLKLLLWGNQWFFPDGCLFSKGSLYIWSNISLQITFTKGSPRYLINQFDQYRFSFDLTWLLSKWSSYKSISRLINWISSIDQFISISR